MATEAYLDSIETSFSSYFSPLFRSWHTKMKFQPINISLLPWLHLADVPVVEISLHAIERHWKISE